jgi:hypothetical protein
LALKKSRRAVPVALAVPEGLWAVVLAARLEQRVDRKVVQRAEQAAPTISFQERMASQPLARKKLPARNRALQSLETAARTNLTLKKCPVHAWAWRS